MIISKRDKVFVLSLLVVILIFACYIRLVMSIQAEANSIFDQKTVASWSSDFPQFEGMKIDDINSAWGKADSATKSEFLKRYITNAESTPQDIKLEGLDNKNLKFIKSGDALTYGDGSSSVRLDDLPPSLKKLSYSPTTAQEAKSTSLQEGNNKFTLEFSDGSKVNLQQGKIENIWSSNSPKEFLPYNKLLFEDNNGNKANLFTNGQFSDVEINKDGKITFLYNSAVQTGNPDDIKYTLSKPIGPTQDASIKMIDSNHIQIIKTITETWRGEIKTSFSPDVTDVIFGNQKAEAESNQYVQLGDNSIFMAGKDISIDLSDKVAEGKELQKITGDGNGISINIQGISVGFDGEKTLLPTIPYTQTTQVKQEPQIVDIFNHGKSIEIINNRDDLHASYQMDIKPDTKKVSEDYSTMTIDGEGNPVFGTDSREVTKYYIVRTLNQISLKSDDNIKYKLPKK